MLREYKRRRTFPLSAPVEHALLRIPQSAKAFLLLKPLVRELFDCFIIKLKHRGTVNIVLGDQLCNDRVPTRRGRSSRQLLRSQLAHS